MKEFKLPDDDVPGFQARVEHRVVGSQDNDQVEPAFREEIAGMVVNNDASIRHQVFQIVHHFVFVNVIRLEFLVVAVAKPFLFHERTNVDMAESWR